MSRQTSSMDLDSGSKTLTVYIAGKEAATLFCNDINMLRKHIKEWIVQNEIHIHIDNLYEIREAVKINANVTMPEEKVTVGYKIWFETETELSMFKLCWL